MIRLSELGWDTDGETSILRERYRQAECYHLAKSFGIDITQDYEVVKELTLKKMKEIMTEKGIVVKNNWTYRNVWNRYRSLILNKKKTED